MPEKSKTFRECIQPSEWLGSKDALGKGERQGLKQDAEGASGEAAGINQEGSKSFKLWSMYGFKSCWSSELRMTLGTMKYTERQCQWKHQARKGLCEGQRLCVWRERAAKSYLGGRLTGGGDLLSVEKEDRKEDGKRSCRESSGQLASCWPHSPGQRRQADQARGKTAWALGRQCSHRMRPRSLSATEDYRGRFE